MHLYGVQSDAGVTPYDMNTLSIQAHTHILLSKNALVTRMILLVRLVRCGMSLTPQIDLGGKDCSKTNDTPPT